MNVPRRFAVAAALVLVAAASAGSQQAQRTPEEYAKFLEGAERVARMQVSRVVEALKLAPGMKVADIGAGSGLFTRPIARTVQPNGIAYAVDVDAELLKIVARTARDQRIVNLQTVMGVATDPMLPERVDLVFLCDTLHHIADRAGYITGLRKHLNPGGRVAVIDFSERWPEGHEPMRYSVAELDQWMSAAGFRRQLSHDWLDNSFFLIFQ